MYPISFFKINFPGNANRIQFTDTRYLFQIIFHDSYKMLLQVTINMNYGL